MGECKQLCYWSNSFGQCIKPEHLVCPLSNVNRPAEAASADGGGEGSKIKTPFARIIVGGTADKPCYSILWWDTEKKECNIGYSSYCLDYVFKWLKDEFEITEEDADVAPVRHGHWIDGADSFGAKRGAYRVCSHCNICIPNTKMVPDRYWQGCPNCLTRMDGDG